MLSLVKLRQPRARGNDISVPQADVNFPFDLRRVFKRTRKINNDEELYPHGCVFVTEQSLRVGRWGISLLGSLTILLYQTDGFTPD